MIKCDYCQCSAELVTGAVIYPNRNDLAHRNFWRCAGCQAYVGCHPPGSYWDKNGKQIHHDGTEPFGRLANAELRSWKQQAHAKFDQLWMSHQMNRKQAYDWLASVLCIPPADCHIGMFDVEQCKKVIEAVIRLKVRTDT